MKYNPFKRGKKMTKQTQTPETENPTVETAESQAEQPTLESLQARIAELEGQLKDEQLRSLAAAFKTKSKPPTNSPRKNSPPKCSPSKTT